MASPKMSLKLLVDKNGQRVLFAEVTKEFVDFLFHIFSLPLGTLIKFLGSQQMVGCLGKLEESIGNFNQTYLQPGIDKNGILNPKSPYKGNVFLLSYDASFVNQSDAPKEIYRCSDESMYKHYFAFDDSPGYSRNKKFLSYVTKCVNAKCPGCGGFMNVKTEIVLSKKEEAAEVKAVGKKRKLTEGYVKEVVTYMVMDDLVVKPMSTISSITFINSFGVKDLSQLEEKTVSFGNDEVMFSFTFFFNLFFLNSSYHLFDSNKI